MIRRRTVLDRIPLDDGDELVVSTADRERIDVRVWTRTAGVSMASANGLTINVTDIPALISALERAATEVTA
jgi:hypothetical protein